MEWDGINWQMSGYFGPLSEVTVSHNFSDDEVITCKRNSFEASAVVKMKCRFKSGTKVEIRKYLKMEWIVCRTGQDMNMNECVVECDD